MSTKIYNGMKITNANTLTKILAFVEDIRITIRNDVHKHRAHEIKMMACVIYDMYHSADKDMIAPEDTTRVPLLLAIDRIVNQNRKDKNTEEYTLCFSSYKGVTYAIPFFHNENSLKTLYDHPQVTDFSYWNNSDGPDNITSQQWDRRCKVWDAILSTSSIPANSMLNIRLIDSAYLIPDDEFMESVPTIAEREEQLSKIIAFQRADDEMKDDKDGDQGVAALINRVNKILPEVKQAVVGSLKPITIEDLGEEIPV